jgi:hypothetical protein
LKTPKNQQAKASNPAFSAVFCAMIILPLRKGGFLREKSLSEVQNLRVGI